MIRLLPLLALALSTPAFADLQKCVDAQGGTVYTDRDCPSTAKHPPAPANAPARPGAVAAPVDAPLEILDTGVPAIVQMPGRFAWLDDDTLAITTYADPHAKAPWMVRRIVAYDMRTRAASVLVPRGFMDCANAGHRLVSLETGDLESRFAVGSRAPLPVQQFAQWDPAARKLVPAADAAGWHPAACLKPAPEDLGVHDLLASRKPLRYLEPEHGLLTWGALDDSGHPAGPTLVTPKKKVTLALTLGEVSHDVRWLPFRKAYQLAPGAHDRLQQPPRDTPLVMMDLDGRIARHPLPAGLLRQLDALPAAGPAEMIATAAGDLVVQPGPAVRGGGLYLVQGEQSRRVWCVAAPAPGQAAGADGCAMSQPIAVSPDGCRIAFDARPANAIANGFPGAPTLKVLTLCDPATPPTAAGRRKGR